MPSSDLRLLAAEWVLPVTAPPVRDGVVAVQGSRIAWMGSRRELPSRFLEAPPRAFPRSLLLPGWVNAHSHLDLTAALGLIPGTAERFTDWLRRLAAVTRAWPAEIVRQAIRAGLDLLASTGTTTVAHVARLPEVEPFLAHPLRSVLFHEAAGFRAAEAGGLLREAEDWLDAAQALISEEGSERITLGLAPRAPWAASPPLLRGLGELAERRGLPLSIHAAETRAEGELLKTGGGPFRELLEEQGDWDPSWSPPGLSPVAYVEAAGLLDRPGLAVHCNDLSAEDVERLARGRLTPVWCPGSHLFFGHPEHPAPRLAARGVPLALGTESLASNTGLTMLREVRLAAARCPEIDRAAWLRAGTLAGAEALGLGAVTGSLEPGKRADLQVLEGVPEETGDPLAALFEADLRVRAVVVDGTEIRIR